MILFVLGGVLTLIEEASKNIDSIFNRKILKFLPVKHIATVFAVIFGLVSLILYCVDRANRMICFILCTIAICLLIAVTAIDIFLIFKNAKRK